MIRRAIERTFVAHFARIDCSIATHFCATESGTTVAVQQISIIALLSNLIACSVATGWRVGFIRIGWIIGTSHNVPIRITSGVLSIREDILRISVIDAIRTLHCRNDAGACEVTVARYTVLRTFITRFVLPYSVRDLTNAIAARCTLTSCRTCIRATCISIITLLGDLIGNAVTAARRVRFIRVVRITRGCIRDVIIRVATGIRAVIAGIEVVVDRVIAGRDIGKCFSNFLITDRSIECISESQRKAIEGTGTAVGFGRERKCNALGIPREHNCLSPIIE